MDRFFTIMVIPEREKGIRSFKIPRLVFKSFAFLTTAFIILLSILSYDYWSILQQVYENKHLTLENRKLKEQIQLHQMKLNTLTEDLKRIKIFEEKLKVITGLDELVQAQDSDSLDQKKKPITSDGTLNQDLDDKVVRAIANLSFEKMQESQTYMEFKDLYDQRIAETFGLQTSYAYTKEWSELTKRSFNLSNDFAAFDYKYGIIKDFLSSLEQDIHRLDQYLLDKESFLRSTPTLLPTNGWVTSYYGIRKSPTSGRIKMHEGIDIGARTGTKIIAPADGIVTFAGSKAGFGKFVQINHGYGIETIFGHAKSVSVKQGQKVRRGHHIASIGSTGSSTGPHVHYEVRVNGIPVDPFYFILEN